MILSSPNAPTPTLSPPLLDNVVIFPDGSVTWTPHALEPIPAPFLSTIQPIDPAIAPEVLPIQKIAPVAFSSAKRYQVTITITTTVTVVEVE